MNTLRKGVSSDLWGCLGGATGQAVRASGNPRRWLEARTRRALVPARRACARPFPVRRAGKLADRMTVEARRRLDALPPVRSGPSGGRPAKRSPDALARELGVAPVSARGNWAERVVRVFARWLDAQRDRLSAVWRALPGTRRGKGAPRAWKQRTLLDRWLPRWVAMRHGTGTRVPPTRAF